VSDDVEELKREVKELREELEKVKKQKNGEAREKEGGEIQGQIQEAVEDTDSNGLSRRDFLKGALGGAAGLSAAAMLPSASAFTFKDDKSFKFGNLSSSNANFEVGKQGDLDLHGNDITNAGQIGSASNPVSDVTVDSIDAERVSNEVYAKNYDGAGLASRVENALNDLKNNFGGQGRVRVTPKDDGTAWTWDKDLVIDPTDFSGLDIDIDRNVEIEYPGDGVAITLNTTFSSRNNRPKRIIGGKWNATGSNPDGWLRLKDTYKTYVEPAKVENFQNSNNNGFGVQLYVSSDSSWTESNKIYNGYWDYNDIHIDTTGPVYESELSGSNVGSFHGTEIYGNRFEVRDIGLRARGGFDHSYVASNSFFTKSDGAVHVQLGGSDSSKENFIDGTTFISNKHEDPGSDNSNDIAYRLAANYFAFKQPALYNNKIFLKSSGTKAKNDSDDSKAHLLQATTVDGGVRWEDLVSGTRMGFNYDGGFDEWSIENIVEVSPTKWFKLPTNDVTSIAGSRLFEGMCLYHNGTGDGAAGPAVYDGSSWYYENGVSESADAEEPQETYVTGQIVYFTDSSDGSGTGTYIIDDSGNPQGPL
jgi:hypothetical protein